jgi:hypothetical protein
LPDSSDAATESLCGNVHKEPAWSTIQKRPGRSQWRQWCATAQTAHTDATFNAAAAIYGAHMYIGGGILGTLLLIVLIIYVVRRM